VLLRWRITASRCASSGSANAAGDFGVWLTAIADDLGFIARPLTGQPRPALGCKKLFFARCARGTGPAR